MTTSRPRAFACKKLSFTISISVGLSREIELRRKQYEYYRDMLLNFPKPEVAK